MSRVGKNPVPIPKGVEVKVDGQCVTVKGPKGELQKTFHPQIGIEMADNEVRVAR